MTESRMGNVISRACELHTTFFFGDIHSHSGIIASLGKLGQVLLFVPSVPYTTGRPFLAPSSTNISNSPTVLTRLKLLYSVLQMVLFKLKL